MSSALTQRRSHGPLLEDGSFRRCHSLFRGGRSVILRDAADHCMDRQKESFQANALWVVSLRPYSALALLVVPVIVLEPAKPLAGYLMATGHFGAAAITFVTAEVLKLTFVEQLFQLNRKKLLSIPAFALGYQYWRQMMDLVGSMEVWQASRRLVENTAHLLRTRWLQFKRVHHLQFRLDHK